MKKTITFDQLKRLVKESSDETKTFLVDVHWDVAKEYEVEANSPEEAKAKIERQLNDGELSYFDDGYESTDDVSIDVVGEKNGEDNEYFS